MVIFPVERKKEQQQKMDMENEKLFLLTPPFCPSFHFSLLRTHKQEQQPSILDFSPSFSHAFFSSSCTYSNDDDDARKRCPSPNSSSHCIFSSSLYSFSCSITTQLQIKFSKRRKWTIAFSSFSLFSFHILYEKEEK